MQVVGCRRNGLYNKLEKGWSTSSSHVGGEIAIVYRAGEYTRMMP